jgi:parallel beta-helix repeat protein
MTSRYTREALLAIVVGFAGLSGQGCSASAEPGGEPSPAEAEHVGAAAEAFRIKFPPIPTMLYSCTDITTPGLYAVGQALTAPSGQPCIQVHSSGVTLDCGNNELNTAWPGQQPLLIQNSQNFTIQNCFIGSIGEYNGPDVQIQNSSNGTLKNNFFARSPVATDDNTLAVVSSSGITFSNNSFAVPISQTNVTNSTIEGNSISCMAKTCSGMIVSNMGSGNSILNNTIDGRATTAQTTHDTGSDDGIIIGDESGDNVSGNTINNVYDCGIEFTGTIESSTFNNNTITNADLCGIGGWYWFNFLGNIVHGNNVSGAANLFTFMRYFGIRPYNWDGNGHAADTGVYFSDNTFDGNSITNPYPTSYWGGSNGDSVFLPFEVNGSAYLLYTGTLQAGSGQTIPTPSQFFLTGNIFSNNNFGSEPAFFGEPMYPGAVIDQGGNVCAKQSFSDFPLACGR